MIDGDPFTDASRPPAETVDTFEAALLATHRGRIEQRRLWDLWNRADSAWAGSWAARPRLSAALTALADAGVVDLPAPGGQLWDSAAPSLPTRIGIPANRRPASPLLDPADEPWTPALSWVAAWIKANRPPQRLRSAAVQVNRWLLATMGTNPPRVAREERSLHIFNNEKRLAALSTSALFNEGRLTLDTVFCDPPLGALRIAVLRPRGRVLVVENKSTFDSLWRALHAASDPGYAAVIFGEGDAAAALIHDLRELPATLGVIPASFDYAGDVDIAGIEGAAAFADAVTTVGLTAAMADRLWDAVARADPTGEDITATPSRSGQAKEIARRLGLPSSVTARLTEGLRVPQERIDRVALADTSWWHPSNM
jgi:hypothetical protein